MSTEFGRVYTYGSGITVRYAHVNEEPAVRIAREAWGQKTEYIIGLSHAFLYTEDDYLWRAASIAAKVLLLDNHTSTLKQLADIMQNHIDELVKLPPFVPELTRQELLEDAIEHHGMKLIVEGENLLR